MSDAWFGLVSGLLGVVVGAVAESFRARSHFRREKWWALFEQRRLRLEELYTVVDEHRAALQHAYIKALTSLHTGGHVDLEGQATVPWARLRMLVAFHAPELTDQFGALQGAANGFGTILGGIIADRSASVDQRKALSGELSTAFDNLSSVYEGFLSKAVSIASELWEGAAGTARLRSYAG